ncbi:MAG: DEAD/DEAH box helicase [Acidilobaceae archaeon]|nr:DEAD/DEAH box helicase [Acidilobaceae archaeon]
MDEVLMKLHERVRKAVESLGFSSLYEVQRHSIGAVLTGDHVLIVAPTGSGKTEAALLPVLSKMLEEPRGKYVKTVYITPLRALNRDLSLRIRRLAEAVGFRAMVRHGDTSAEERKEFLSNPPDILITTPESLNLLLTLRDYRKIWGRVGWVIVDEVQEMLESERGAELAVVLERLSLASARKVQRIGLSATLSKQSILEAKTFLSTTERVRVVRGARVKEYDFRVELTRWTEIPGRLTEVAAESQVLIFANTRALAEEMGAQLNALMPDLARVHHSSLERRVREEAERDFREGKLKALIATSSMELGIDIGSIETVVQLLSPRQVVRLAQRAGRAGHRQGAVSRALILAPDNLYEALESLIIAERTKLGYLEDLEGHEKPYDVLAHQLTAMVVEGSVRNLEEALILLRRAKPFQQLSMDELRAVAEHLHKVGVLRLKDDGSLVKSRRAFEYLYGVTMIPDERFYTVTDMVSEQKVGKLSEVFVELELLTRWTSGKSSAKPRFVLAGRIWEVVDIDPEEENIVAKPTATLEGVVPYWVGDLIPVSREVAQEVCSQMAKIMMRGEAPFSKVGEVLKETKKMWGRGFVPGDVIVEDLGEASILYSCLGSRGNFALALLLSSLMEMGAVEHSVIPYAIFFKAPAMAVVKAIERARGLSAQERREAVIRVVKSTRAFTFRFYHVAKRMGVIEAGAKADKISLRSLAKWYEGTVVEKETLRELEHEKLDFEALESFFQELRDISVVDGPSKLSEEVLSNPYVRRDVMAMAKVLASESLVEGKKKALLKKRVLMTCYICGNSKEFRVEELGEYRCPNCGAVYVVPLPPTEEGWKVAEIIRKKAQGGKLSKEEEGLLKKYKVDDLASLHANYYQYSRQLVMALVAKGVGPQGAKRAMEAFMRGGEKSLLLNVIELEEKYFTTREYWDL